MIKGKKRILNISIVLVGLLFIFVLGWIEEYPSPADPKNIRYVLWKAGLKVENLDKATAAMVGDTHRDRVVVGLTKGQLREKFEYLLAPSEAGPYLRGAHELPDWKDKDVLFIRESPWMVVFERDTAVDLVLVKGY
jgi:hypothetical protein